MSDIPLGTNPVLQVDELALCSGERRRERLISFQVARGEILTIAGTNGSGKSVLLSCLAGQRTPTSGRVQVFGLNIRHRRQRAKAQSLLGVLFQRAGLVRTLNVFENVALPFLVDSLDVSHGVEQQIRLRLRLVGCEHVADENPEKLSVGERRLVAFARALSGNSRILLADEPVAELSSDRRLMIEELISTLVKCGALDAAVLFTQDLDLAARVSSRLIALRPPDPAEQTFGGILYERDLRTSPPALRLANPLTKEPRPMSNGDASMKANQEGGAL